MARKVWLVCLSIITATFLLWLVYESIQYRREYPLSFMTDEEVEEMAYQDMIEKGFIDPTTGKIILY